MSMLQIRIDDRLKDEASALFDNLGLDLSTAVRMFLKKCVTVGGIPFDVSYTDGTIEFLKAIKSMQEKSINLGNDKMTLDEINEEINLTRMGKNK